MAKNESSKSKAEVYREERKARIAKAAKQNAKSIEKRNAFSKVAKKVISIVLVVAIVCGIAWKFVDSFGLVERFATAVTVGDTKVTAAHFNYFYVSQYQQMSYYAQQYSQYGYDMGYDTSVAPDEQDSTEKDEDGNAITWAESFENSAVSNVQYILAYYNEAIKAGYELTDDEKTEINETIESYRSSAAENNYSLNAYLRQTFGAGFTEKIFKNQLEMEKIAQRFNEDKAAELKEAVKDEDIKAEYAENRKDYDYADVRYFAFNFSTLTAEEGETDDELAARQEKANSELTAKAKSIYDSLTDVKSFSSAITTYKNEGSETPSDTDFTTLSENTTYSSLTAATSEETADWAFDVARKAGDKSMIIGEKAIYIIYVITPIHEMNSVSVRHCLVEFDAEDSSNVTDEEKSEAKVQAEALYQDWLAGEKTEESFSEMAKESSEDTGSQEDGGLYANIRISDSYVQAFKDWSFDPARKAGDTEIIETEYGYHIMYFVSDNTDDPDWYNTIKEADGEEAFESYEEALLAEDGSYPVKSNDTWTGMVSKDFCNKIRKNLAYS